MTGRSEGLYSGLMEVPLKVGTETRIQQLAAGEGRDAGRYAAELLEHYLAQDEEFRASVRRAIDQADRGELIDHEEVVERIESMFRK